MTRKPPCLLPDHVMPFAYTLFLEPNLKDFRFTGTAKIDFLMKRPTDQVVLHAAGLTINEAYINLVERKNKSEFPVSIDADAKKQTLTLKFRDALSFGLGQLTFHYSGVISDQLCGLYRSKYKVRDEERYLAATQCEAIDARRIFPCWDEPAYKALFRTGVIIPEHLTAISNMPEVSKGAWGQKKVLGFASTPPMSTYLFALFVGEFEWVEGKTKDGVIVRICTTPGKKELGRFALERAIKTLEFYTEYYGYPYPLPKADLLAIPDFGAGAMENWGADAFREQLLLCDPENTSQATRERICEVIDHELGHQWHGDLLTMDWWDGLWLNESFATCTEYLVSRHLDDPEVAEEKVVAEDCASAKDEDALTSTRPVHVQIDHPDDIGEAFDGITYAKGGSVLRMLEHWLGPETNQAGLRIYIPRHAYGSVTQEDLWRALGGASFKPVSKMVDGWVNQPGYPIVFANRERGNPHAYKLSQRRFSYRPDYEGNCLSQWIIPMSIKTRRDPNITESLVLEFPDQKINLEKYRNEGEWILFNAGGKGFFRVQYCPEDLILLKDAILRGELSAVDRITLLDDMFALTKAGYYNVDQFLGFAEAFRGEKNLRVWQILEGALGKIELLFVGRDASMATFDPFVNSLAKKSASELGWEALPSDKDQDKILRGLLLRLMGQATHVPTVRTAREQFAGLFQGRAINPDIRRAVYGIIAAFADDQKYDLLLGLYRSTDLQEEQGRILGALTDCREFGHVARTLKFLLSDEVRTQDVYLHLRTLATNPASRDMTWEFIKENWQKLAKMYEAGKYLPRVISAVCPALSGRDAENDVRTFFGKNPVPEAKRTIAQALERIQINTAWADRDKNVFTEWAKKQPKRGWGSIGG